LVQRQHVTVVIELPGAAVQVDLFGKGPIRLGADEVVRGNRNGVSGWLSPGAAESHDR
jgi:hypothetical protein